jgi:hypothetical protein
MACGARGSPWPGWCCRSCRGWSLQCTLAEAQTQTQTMVQTQAHGVHMHTGRTDTDTCAQSTYACTCSVAMVKLEVVHFIGKGISRDSA